MNEAHVEHLAYRFIEELNSDVVSKVPPIPFVQKTTGLTRQEKIKYARMLTHIIKAALETHGPSDTEIVSYNR